MISPLHFNGADSNLKYISICPCNFLYDEISRFYMKKVIDNLDAVISGKGVKLHYFEPSKREIWTVVGKENEHWLDPEFGFCSCEDYFFNTLNGGNECYHLKSIRIAKEQNKVEVIRFSDDEFANFVSALISDL